MLYFQPLKVEHTCYAKKYFYFVKKLSTYLSTWAWKKTIILKVDLKPTTKFSKELKKRGRNKKMFEKKSRESVDIVCVTVRYQFKMCLRLIGINRTTLQVNIRGPWENICTLRHFLNCYLSKPYPYPNPARGCLSLALLGPTLPLPLIQMPVIVY